MALGPVTSGGRLSASSVFSFTRPEESLLISRLSSHDFGWILSRSSGVSVVSDIKNYIKKSHPVYKKGWDLQTEKLKVLYYRSEKP
jgi:hypothetical protein